MQVLALGERRGPGRPGRTSRLALPGVALALALTACGGGTPTSSPAPAPAPSPPVSARSASTGDSPTGTPQSAPQSTPPSRAPAPGTVPPSWLGTRPLPRAADGYGVVRPTPPALRNRRFTLPDSVPMLPGTAFASRVETAPADVIARSTWQPGCPVARDQLSWIRLTFWGFDDRRHTGELLVNSAVADDVVTVFRALYAARWPIEQMRITTKAELDEDPTGDGNVTESFVCRPSTGQRSGFSQHAYGLAIDVDPFQNPYVKGDRVLPELASAYLDRSRRAPGVIHPGDVVTRAFSAVGWGWGGDWHSLKDYQHFSSTGR